PMQHRKRKMYMRRRFGFLYHGILSSFTRRETMGSADVPTFTLTGILGFCSADILTTTTTIWQLERTRVTRTESSRKGKPLPAPSRRRHVYTIYVFSGTRWSRSTYDGLPFSFLSVPANERPSRLDSQTPETVCNPPSVPD